MGIDSSYIKTRKFINFLKELILNNGIEHDGNIALENKNTYVTDCRAYNATDIWTNFARFAMVFTRDSKVDYLDNAKICKTLSGDFGEYAIDFKDADNFLEVYGISMRSLKDLRKIALACKDSSMIKQAISNSGNEELNVFLDKNIDVCLVEQKGRSPRLEVAITNKFEVKTTICSDSKDGDIIVRTTTPPVILKRDDKLGGGEYEIYEGDNEHIVKDIRNAVAHNLCTYNSSTLSLECGYSRNMAKLVIPMGWMTQFCNYYISDRFVSINNDKLQKSISNQFALYVSSYPEHLNTPDEVLEYLHGRKLFKVTVLDECNLETVNKALSLSRANCAQKMDKMKGKVAVSLLLTEIYKAFKKFGINNIKLEPMDNKMTEKEDAFWLDTLKDCYLFFADNFGQQTKLDYSLIKFRESVFSDLMDENMKDYAYEKMYMMYKALCYNDPKLFSGLQEFYDIYFDLEATLREEERIESVFEVYYGNNQKYSQLKDKLEALQEKYYYEVIDICKNNSLYKANNFFDENQSILLNKNDKLRYMVILKSKGALMQENWLKSCNAFIDIVEQDIENLNLNNKARMKALISSFRESHAAKDIKSLNSVYQSDLIQYIGNENPQLLSRGNYVETHRFYPNARRIYQGVSPEKNIYEKLHKAISWGMRQSHDYSEIKRMDSIINNYHDNQIYINNLLVDRKVDIINDIDDMHNRNLGEILGPVDKHVSNSTLKTLFDIINNSVFNSEGEKLNNKIAISKNNLERLLVNKRETLIALSMFESYMSLIHTGLIENLADNTGNRKADATKTIKAIDMSAITLELIDGIQTSDPKIDVAKTMRHSIAHGNVYINNLYDAQDYTLRFDRDLVKEDNKKLNVVANATQLIDAMNLEDVDTSAEKSGPIINNVIPTK